MKYEPLFGFQYVFLKQPVTMKKLIKETKTPEAILAQFVEWYDSDERSAPELDNIKDAAVSALSPRQSPMDAFRDAIFELKRYGRSQPVICIMGRIDFIELQEYIRMHFIELGWQTRPSSDTSNGAGHDFMVFGVKVFENLHEERGYTFA